MGAGEKPIKNLDDNGWNASNVQSYMLYQYKFDGGRLVMYGIDGNTMKKAIKDGKVKGTIEDNSARFTDTTENLARFVKEAGDSL